MIVLNESWLKSKHSNYDFKPHYSLSISPSMHIIVVCACGWDHLARTTYTQLCLTQLTCCWNQLLHILTLHFIRKVNQRIRWRYSGYSFMYSSWMSVNLQADSLSFSGMVTILFLCQHCQHSPIYFEFIHTWNVAHAEYKHCGLQHRTPMLEILVCYLQNNLSFKYSINFDKINVPVLLS